MLTDCAMNAKSSVFGSRVPHGYLCNTLANPDIASQCQAAYLLISLGDSAYSAQATDS
jgi:hypothetical protein